jgi:hypothetical protein
MSFGTYAQDDQVLSSDAVITPMWSNNNTTLNRYYSSSQEQTNTGKFFLGVYNGDLQYTASSEEQFAIAYGNIYGSGSGYFNGLVPYNTPTRNIYSQFRSLIYGDENTAFTFGSSTSTSRDIIVISIDRARFKESFNPGSFFLTLKSGSAAIGLVDDSTVATTSTYIGTSRVYQILSGSYNPSSGTTTPSSSAYTVSGSYGMIIPDEGLIILNPRALALAPGPLGGIGAIFNEQDSSTVTTYFQSNIQYNLNNRMIYDMMQAAPTFSLQAYETLSSRYFFTRVKNAEFNYTANPTIIDNNGNLLYTQLIYNPQTYITTVGLYNNSGDLLAVAKLNKPLVKDFTKELLLRVKLDF